MQQLGAVGSVGSTNSLPEQKANSSYCGRKLSFRGVTRLALFVALWGVFLLVDKAQPASGAAWLPATGCVEHCRDADHMCPTSTCQVVWDKCPEGTAQRGESFEEVDPHDCKSTGCKRGGCEDGTVQVNSTQCLSAECGFATLGFCTNEMCCRKKQRVKCCELLPCNLKYLDCDVPQQLSMNNPAHSLVERETMGHNSTVLFPFYKAAWLPTGSSCMDADARLWGQCVCDDGHLLPGCDAYNSSSWYMLTSDDSADLNATQMVMVRPNATSPRLPANLSQICQVQQPQPPLPQPPLPQPPDAAAATSADAAGAAGEQQQPPPQQQSGRRSHSSYGGLVAVIVVGCVALAAGTAGMVLWCCGMLPDLHNLRIQSLTSYEPVFTGQSYTPGLGGHGNQPTEDIPWARFCAAVADGFRRLRYGRRYRQDAADAAAAAERYRALNSLSSRGRPSAAGAASVGGGGAAADTEGSGLHVRDKAGAQHRHLAGPAAGDGNGGPAPRLAAPAGLGVYSIGDADEYDEEYDELGASEVFTLADLGARSSETVGRRGAHGFPRGAHMASKPYDGRGGGGGGGDGGLRRGSGGSGLPVSIRASGGEHPSPSGAAAAAAQLDLDEPHAQGRPRRSRLNQFGDDVTYGSTAIAAAGGGGGSADVIHTRPLVLSDDDGGGGRRSGGGGGDAADDDDLDAPLHLFPTPQTTGQGGSATQRGPPL